MKLSRACFTFLVLGWGLVPVAGAEDLNSLQALAQREFRLLSEDLGAALSYKGLVPAEPLGITGFDAGVALTATSFKNVELLERAASGSDIPKTVPVPSLRIYKGLPLNIDVGLSYAAIPGTNVKMVGGELRWAVLPGSTTLPAVAIRASMTRLQGVDQLKLDTQGLDVSVSKGFAMATPYIGVGVNRVKSSPQGVPSLVEESFNQNKIFGGVNLNFGLANLALEADVTDSRTSYGLKFGFRF